MPSPRAKAAVIIHRVLQGKSLNQLLPHSVESLELGQRALCQELVYGTLREPALSGHYPENFPQGIEAKRSGPTLANLCGSL